MTLMTFASLTGAFESCSDISVEYSEYNVPGRTIVDYMFWWCVVGR